MKPKDTFIIDQRYKERFKRWGAEKGYAIFMAMFEYEETGEINLPEEYYDAFEPIKEDLDARKKKWEEVCERNRQNGQNGGRPKKTEREDDKPTETKKTHSVIEKPKKADKDIDIDIDIKKKTNKKENDLFFEQFWQAYPRKVSKQTAYKAFSRLNVTQEILDKMLQAIELQKKSDQWQDERYIPHPTTWLNGARWNDELPKATQTKKYADYLQRPIKENPRFGMEYLDRSS